MGELLNRGTIEVWRIVRKSVSRRFTGLESLWKILTVARATVTMKYTHEKQPCR